MALCAASEEQEWMACSWKGRGFSHPLLLHWAECRRRSEKCEMLCANTWCVNNTSSHCWCSGATVLTWSQQQSTLSSLRHTQSVCPALTLKSHVFYNVSNSHSHTVNKSSWTFLLSPAKIKHDDVSIGVWIHRTHINSNINVSWGAVEQHGAWQNALTVRGSLHQINFLFWLRWESSTHWQQRWHFCLQSIKMPLSWM